jgi:hypothetical protein
MASDNFTLIFDVANAGYRQWTFLGIGLGLTVIGSLLIVYQLYRPPSKRGSYKRLFPYLFTAFALVWTLAVFTGTYWDYLRLRSASRNGSCEIVQGTITNFVPMPKEGHATEHFVVNGHYFEYSDFTATAGFNNTQSHGGPLAEGRLVRICSLDGEIARLEIAW